MVDHLPLPPGQEIGSRRRAAAPRGGRKIDRPSHASKLVSDLDRVTSQADQDLGVDADPRLVLKFQAATRLSNGPLRGLQLLQLGESQGWTYAVLSDSESRQLLERLITEYALTSQGSNENWDHPATWAQLLDNVEDISIYGADDRADPELSEVTFDPPTSVDIVIWPSSTDSEAESRLEAVAQLVSEEARRNPRVEVLSSDGRPQTTSLRARVDAQALDRILQDSWVERVRLPLRTPFTRRSINMAPLPDTLPEPTGSPIGILDGVVADANPLLDGRVVDRADFPMGHVFAGPDLHGTGVATICCWGSLDFVVTESPAPASSPIVSARVLDIEAGTGDHLVIPGQDHTTLEAAIRWLVGEKNCKVVSMSINKDRVESRILRSEVCKTLDTLIRELQFVLIISSGNRYDSPSAGWLDGYPNYLLDEEARVTDPADAALAVTVGAVAHRDIPSRPPVDQMTPVARAGDPSPFARCGPVRGRTREGTAKPEFSHSGGNMAHDHATGSVDFGDPGLSVIVGTPPVGGQFLTTEVGSSYAAPAVAYEVARICARYPAASSNMLRALTALSARRSESSPLVGVDAMRASLYGVPNADRILESGGPVAILTIEGEMATNAVVVHELPVPYEFAQGGTSRDLRVALAFDPPVLRSRREYIAGWMGVQLVRGLSLEEVVSHYELQPTEAEIQADPTLIRRELPSGRLRPRLTPTSSQLASNTLIRRDYVDQSWDPDDESYFLVISHNLSPWTDKQKKGYERQHYALAVQLVDNERVELDLHGLVRARLQARGRGRIRLGGAQ